MANQNKPTSTHTDDRGKQNQQNNPANQRNQGNPKQGNPGDRGSEQTRDAQGGKPNERKQSMKEETEKSRGEA
jgi:hypothetical protein